jgi:hypothetical protein
LAARDRRNVAATSSAGGSCPCRRNAAAPTATRGLPITSAYVESTIKQLNRRVKGSEKFWSETGAEALLQLSADYLSDRTPLDRFWRNRHEQCTGARSYR